PRVGPAGPGPARLHRRPPHDLPGPVREDRPAAQGRPRHGRDALRDLRLSRQRLPDRAGERSQRPALARSRGARTAGLPPAVLRDAPLHRVRPPRQGDPTSRSPLLGLIAAALLAAGCGVTKHSPEAEPTRAPPP